MPKIVAILNCTPDSFYDGGKYFDHGTCIQHGIKLAEEGADILDIGGESTRPFSQSVSEKEELRRVLPIIRALKEKLSIPLSIDTKKPAVAQAAIREGISIINDVNGLNDPQLRELVAKSNVQAICMHMQGTPASMQKTPFYPKGVVAEVMEWFEKKLQIFEKEGIAKEKIIFDPGIGFGKTVEHNLEILKNIKRFCTLQVPLLIGLSRKSFIQKILKKQASEVLSTTLALNTISMLDGASFIRVHDVKEHRQIIDFLKYWFIPKTT